MQTFENPIHFADEPALDIADPHPVLHAGTLHVYATQARAGKPTIQHFITEDMVRWFRNPDAIDLNPHRVASKDRWAPSVALVRDTYVMYLVRRQGITEEDPMAIALAIAKEDLWNFDEQAEPIMATDMMDLDRSMQYLDPFPFVDPVSGRLYLFFGGWGASICGCLMDGIQHVKPGSLRRIIKPDPEDEYLKIPEGACVYYQEKIGRYVMLVSGSNTWGIYGVTAFAARAPLGPYEKVSKALVGNWEWEAPGQVGVFQDVNGSYWAAYHAVNSLNRTADSPRECFIEPIHHMPDGRIRIGDGTPSVGPIPAPILK